MIFQTLLPDFPACGGTAAPGGNPAPLKSPPPAGGSDCVGAAPGGTLGALPIIAGATSGWYVGAGATGGWYVGAGATGGWYVGAGVAMIVASTGGCGGCMSRPVIFGRMIVSLPVERGGSFTGGGATGGGGMLGVIRAPQFPQKRSSAFNSLWQFGHCAISSPLSSRYLNMKCKPGSARIE